MNDRLDSIGWFATIVAAVCVGVVTMLWVRNIDQDAAMIRCMDIHTYTECLWLVKGDEEAKDSLLKKETES